MTLTSLFRVIRRRWRLVLLVLVAATIAMAEVESMFPEEYTASASLVVSPLARDPLGSGGQEVNIQTEREIISSSEVARRAAERLGVEFGPYSYLLTQRDVAAPSGSQVLIVSVSAQTALEAADAADAIASAYLEFRQEGAEATAEQYIAAIDQRLEDLSSSSDPDSNALAATLLEQRHQLTLVGSDPGRIIGYASLPDSPSSPGLTVFLAVGVVGGLLAGAFLALMRERLDRRVTSPDRLAALVGHGVHVATAHAEDDAWHRISFSLRHALTVRSHGPRVLSVLGPGVGQMRGILNSLEKALEHAPVSVAIEARTKNIEPPQPQGGTALHDPDILIADLTDLDSIARVAAVCERSIALVLIATAKTTLRQVNHAMESASLSGLETVHAVFLKPAQPRRRRLPEAS